MPRSPRITEPGLVYHLLNRRVMRLPLFDKDADYDAFERVLAESLGRPDAPSLLAYCLMPNHWHLAVRAGPRTDLSTWMQRVTVTHTHRWHARRAKLVKRAENWQWNSLWIRQHGRSELARWLRDWPVDRPRNWVAEVNRRMDEEAMAKVRKSLVRGVPLGGEAWTARIAARLGLDMTLRPRGRPRKGSQNSS